MQEFFKEAEAILGEGGLIRDRAELTACAAMPNFDASPAGREIPLAAAKPVNLDQAARLLALCSRHKLAVRIRGGGSQPGRPYSPHCLLLLTSALNRIFEIDAENRLLRLQGGTPCQALQKAAAARGLFYPPALPGLSTIGGNLAGNALSTHVLKYGGDFVESLEIILASGQRLLCKRRNGQPGKLIPGLPLAALFCGSRGCLGLIGEATLRLLPLPPRREALMAIFAGADDAAQAASALMASSLLPDRLDLLDAACAACLDLGDKSLLLLEFAGEAEAVTADLTLARQILAQNGVKGIVEAQADCPLDKIPAALGPCLWNSVACPPSRLRALMEGIAQIARGRHVEAAIYGQAALAAMRVAFFHKNREDAARAAKDLFTLELVLNKALANEAELDMNREQWQKAHARQERLSRDLRLVFDPDAILVGNALPAEGDLA